MINKNLNIDLIVEEYKENKFISIDNFLETEIAEILYMGLRSLTQKNLWYQVNYGNPRFYNPNLKGFKYISEHFTYKYEKYPVKNIPLDGLIKLDSNRINTQHLESIKNNPEFELPESHPLRKFGDQINSNQMHDFITKITGHELSYNKVTCFASKYTAGDFNGSHNDGNLPRKVAFVLNMTKEWLPHWGGNLAIFDDSFTEIKRVFMPRFNNLVLFDVPLSHAVLPVSIFCQSERYALTGWFHKYD